MRFREETARRLPTESRFCGRRIRLVVATAHIGRSPWRSALIVDKMRGLARILYELRGNQCARLPPQKPLPPDFFVILSAAGATTW